jgi:hypothetical protein
MDQPLGLRSMPKKKKAGSWVNAPSLTKKARKEAIAMAFQKVKEKKK